MIHSITQWLLHNGIGQNVSAGGIMGTPTVVWARRKLIKHVENIHLHIRLGAEYDKQKE